MLIKWDIFHDILSHWFILLSFGSDLLQEVKPLTDASKSIVEQKMDNMNGVYAEALTQLKALSSQLTTMPASELIQKVDQIVGQYQFRRMSLLS